MNVRLFHSFINGRDYGKATSFLQGEGNTRAWLCSSQLVIFTRVRIRSTPWKMMKGLLLVYWVPIYGMDLAIFDFFSENMIALPPGLGLGRGLKVGFLNESAGLCWRHKLCMFLIIRESRT